MSTRTVRAIAAWSGALAVVTWLFVVPLNVTGPLRAIVGMAFALVAPGFCLLLAGGVRELSQLTLLGSALSLSLASLLSVFLMFVRLWSVDVAVTLMAVLTVGLAVAIVRQTLRQDLGGPVNPDSSPT